MSDDTKNDNSKLPPKISVRKAPTAQASESAHGDAPKPSPLAAPSPPAAQSPQASGPSAVRPLARPKTIVARPVVRPTSASVTPRTGGSVAPPVDGPEGSTHAAAAGIRPRTIKAKPIGLAAEEAKAKSGDEELAPVRVAAKRETTKIALEAALPKDATQKTVKAVTPAAEIKVSPAGGRAEAPLAVPDVSPEVATQQATSAAAKRTTSRISLEAVLGAEVADGDGPKTIRLKRPGATTSARVEPVTTVRKKPVVQAAESAETEAETDGADESAGGSDPSATQRKTIVVKKSGSQTPRKQVSVSRASGEDGEVAASASSKPKVKSAPSEPGWIFGAYSLAAVLITCVLIYVVTAQVVGPNASLTEYSYAKTGPDLPWPGKLAGPRSY